MAYFTKQNKTVVVAALTLFLASLSATFFFLSDDLHNAEDLKADVIHGVNETPQSEYQEYFNLLQDQEGIVVSMTLDGKVNMSFPDPQWHGEQFFSLIAPEDLPSLISAIGKVVSSENSLSMVGPFRMQHYGSDVHWYMASLYPLKAHEKVTGIIVVARDISENLKQDNPPHNVLKNNMPQQHTQEENNTQARKIFSLWPFN